MRPSRSSSRISRISTNTMPGSSLSLSASSALTVSISALASASICLTDFFSLSAMRYLPRSTVVPRHRPRVRRPSDDAIHVSFEHGILRKRRRSHEHREPRPDEHVNRGEFFAKDIPTFPQRLHRELHRLLDLHPSRASARRLHVEELRNPRGLHHAAIVGKPAHVRAAPGIAGKRSDPVLRELVGQVKRDRGGFEHERAVVGYRGHLALRMKVFGVARAATVRPLDVHRYYLVGRLQLLEQKDEARGAGSRMMIESD